jgi:hypothetical protein
MRTISSAGQAILASSNVPMVILVAMAFSTPLNLWSGAGSLTVGGVTYQGTQGIGKIGAVQTTYSEIRQLTFELAGPPQSMVSLATGPGVQGTPVTVSVGLVNLATGLVTDVIPMWAGQLDTMKVIDGTKTSTVQVTAEHVGIDLNRPAPLYYTDADQQTLHPGDLFFQYVSTQFDQQIVWPAASYFRK